MLSEIRDELLKTPPVDAISVSNYIVQLAAILGNIHDEIARHEGAYIHTLASLIRDDSSLSGSKAKIMAMDTEAYHSFQAAKRASELCSELIAGLKYRSRALQREWGDSKHQ